MVWHARFIAAGASIIFIIGTHTSIQAAIVEYKLAIAQQEVNITGKPTLGMTINGNSPGPTLNFQEGDTARIHVHNRMDVETSIHWHGVLVPPNMDGVPYVSFPPIMPGATFTYEFPIRHSGTYWYHSHTGLQEQKGVYGAIVIKPHEAVREADRDYVVIISDWTDEDTHDVLRILKRGSEWYALEKGSAQSIIGAARIGMLGDYFKRELLRMPPMDISDIAYDFFLANGQPEIALSAEPGETVRLRIINAGAGTNFYIEFAGGAMTIITADGQVVEPVNVQRLMIAIAETYDLLIRIPSAGAYEFRATAQDGSGYTSAWIGSGERHPAQDVPHPNLYHTMGAITIKQLYALTPPGAMGMTDNDVDAGKFDRPGMMNMKPMDMSKIRNMSSMEPMTAHPGMSMTEPDKEKTKHNMPQEISTPKSGKMFSYNFRPLAADVSSSKNLAVDGRDPSRPWPPYSKLRATKPTAFPEDKPVREIRLTLDGDMERYIWLLNNKTLAESDVIRIRQGEVVRFIFINRTMMHHPMHLHGHFFRVINGQGDYAPLKHTVNVAPMSTTVIEFAADEFGDWFFHCHLLYHMKGGMARVVHYEGFTVDPQLASIRPKLYKDSWYSWGQADALGNMTEGFLSISNTRNILIVGWEVGWQEVDDTQWEAIITWDRYINRFFTLFAGTDLTGASNDLEETRAVLGIRYLLPLNVESRSWIDSGGGGRFNLGKLFELTPRLALFGESQYDTRDLWEDRASLSYLVHKNFTIVGQWHSDYGFGGGLQIRF